jgi:hypothetical protein
MEMYGVMSMASTMMIPYVTALVLLPMFLYALARWRQTRSGRPDPHLGIKSALAYFRVISFQVTLAGGWLLIYSMVHDGDSGELVRAAFGLLIPGGLVLAGHQAALQRTNYRLMSMPVRMFDGLNLVQTGLIGFIALVFSCVVTLQKNPEGELLRIVWSLSFVYVGAWMALLGGFMSRLPPPDSDASPIEDVVTRADAGPSVGEPHIGS